MKEYIEREMILALANKMGAYGMDISSRDVKKILAADAAEVKHGEWIWNENRVDWGISAWECSVCHCKPETWWEIYKESPYRCAGSSYCPNCGAKMDGGVNNATD